MKSEFRVKFEEKIKEKIMPVMKCDSCGRTSSTATSNTNGDKIVSCHVAVDGGVWVKGCSWNDKPEQLGDIYREVVKSKMEFPDGVQN